MKLLHLIHHLSTAPQPVILPCPMPIRAGRVSAGQASTSSPPGMSVPSPGTGPARQDSRGEPERCKAGSCCGSGVGVWARKRRFQSFLCAQPRKSPLLPETLLHWKSHCQLAASKAKREAEASRSCSAAAVGSRPREQRTSSEGEATKELANKPQPISFWPQTKKPTSIAASTGRSQPNRPSPALSSGCRRVWNLGCLIEVVPPLSTWSSSLALVASFHNVCRDFIS